MPRKGPLRPLFSVRADETDVKWVQERAAQENTPYPDFARRILAFARHTMPTGWLPPEANSSISGEAVDAPSTKETE